MVETLKNHPFGIFFSTCGKEVRDAGQGFSSRVLSIYLDLKERGHMFEIIFVCMDGSEEEWTSYYAGMPWLAIRYDDFATADDLYDYAEAHGSLIGCPWLLLLDGNGFPLNEGNGRMMFMRWGSLSYPWTIESLKARKALEDKFIDSLPKKIKIPKVETLLELGLNEEVGWACQSCKMSGLGWGYHNGSSDTRDGWKFSYHPRCGFGIGRIVKSTEEPKPSTEETKPATEETKPSIEETKRSEVLASDHQ